MWETELLQEDSVLQISSSCFVLPFCLSITTKDEYFSRWSHRGPAKLHFSSPVNEIFWRRKSLLYFMWIQDERCQNLSHALILTSPNLHDRSTQSDTAGPVVSLYPVSRLSFLSLPPSLQSISHLKCPGIFLQMSINRQIDFISSAALLQSWWMNLTFLSSHGDIVWCVFLFYILGGLAGMFNSEVVLSEFYRTKTKMYFPGPMVQN